MKFKRLVHDGSLIHATGFVEDLPDLDSCEFIEAFYPNYQRCDDIMYHDDLACYLDGEITKKGFCARVGYEENRPKARLQIEHDNMQAKFRLEALENFYRMVKEHEIKIIEDEGFFRVTRVHRDDLSHIGYDASKISDADMETIADKLGDDYCSQLFWESLKIIAEIVLKREPENEVE